MKLGRVPVFGSEYSSMYDKLEGVKGPCLQGWWVSRVRIACAFWMIGEGLTEKKPVFNIPCLFGSKYVRLDHRVDERKTAMEHTSIVLRVVVKNRREKNNNVQNERRSSP